MKKIVLICLALFSAVMLYARPLEYIESGSYGYYIDKRGDRPFARGYLVFASEDDSTLLCANTIDLTTGKSYHCVTLLVNADNGDFTFGDMSMQEVPAELKNHVLQVLPDLYNFDSMYRSSVKKIDFDSVLEDSWGTFSQYYHFSKLLPMFKFSKISLNSPDEDKAYYYARQFGVLPVTTDSVNVFLSMNVTDFVPGQRDTTVEIPQAAKKKVKMNGISYNLDENWKLNKLEENDSWWLQVDSIRDAQITVEPLPEGVDVKTMEAKLNMAAKWPFYVQNMLPSTIKYWKKGQDIYIMYDVYDEDGTVTTSMVGISSKVFINFSAFKDVYVKNEAYFKKILGLK